MKIWLLNPVALVLLLAIAIYVLWEALRAAGWLFAQVLRRRAERREQLRPVWPRPQSEFAADRRRELLEHLRAKNDQTLAKRRKKGPPAD